VVIAAGFCSLVGIRSTLVISQVIPFLILAIGCDNMFILSNALKATDKSKSVEERVGDALASVGTSITLAALSEFLAFMLGSLTSIMCNFITIYTF
jgi:Niemann-Pick C1 protein